MLCVCLALAAIPASAQLDRILKGRGDGDNSKTASGLKEALSVGARETVNLTGHVDGYLKNEAIKILVPEKMRTLEKSLRTAGMGSQIDEFEVSMNRAAEKAAPAALPIFQDAIRQMTFEDARGILSGGNTAATQYLKSQTGTQLKAAFRPVVESAMDETGVVKRYRELTGGSGGGLSSLAGSLSALAGRGNLAGFDINDYVVTKALDGLFFVLGQQEQKIRTNPAAQVTPLLKEVFGKY